MQFRNFPPQQIGFPVRADWARKVIDAIEESRPRPRPGQTMNRNSYGVMLGEEPGAAKEVEFSESFPFKVRWMFTDKDRSSGEWQIFLPRGCASVTQGLVNRAYVPVNDKAKDENGDEIYKWYKIPTPKDKDATVGKSGGYVAKQWSVNILMKPWPRMLATTEDESKDFGASKWSVKVATISVIERDERSFHHVSQIVREGGIVNEWDTSGAFAIEYEMESDEPKSKAKARIINQQKMLGRLFKENVEPKEINGWKSVWIKIKHESTEFELTVEKELSGKDARSDDDKTVICIYRMKDDVVENDSRYAIPNSDFYTNGPDVPGA